MTKQDEIFQRVTDSIVRMLETAGQWRMPWHFARPAAGEFTGFTPLNISGRPYRGVNVWYLLAEKEAHGYSSNVWGTYKAWKAAGAQVRKGEKATKVVFWNRTKKTVRDDETGEDETRQFLFATDYPVFNADQVDGWQPKAKPVKKARTAAQRIEHADAFFSALNIEVMHGGSRACYIPSIDQINLPHFEQFKTAEDYYSIRGHESVHATGNAKRCDREFGKRFGDQAYAFEELVAELGAAFICCHLEISNEPREDHAAYVKNWLKVLKDDKRAIFTAASKAQTAVNWLIKAAGEAAEEGEEGDESDGLAMAA